MKKYKIIWKVTLILTAILSILVFTPLVTPSGKSTPELFGLPYTLWMGIGFYLSFLILIAVGISVHSILFKEEQND